MTVSIDAPVTRSKVVVGGAGRAINVSLIAAARYAAELGQWLGRSEHARVQERVKSEAQACGLDAGGCGAAVGSR